MARKESLDRSLFLRVRTQMQTTDTDTLVNSASADMLAFIRSAPLTYGFWADFKRLYKAAEKSTPLAPTAALLARLDTADLPRRSLCMPEPPLANQINGPGRIEVSGSHAYVLNLSWNSQGVSIVDITAPAQPVIDAHIKQPGVVDLAIHGSKLFLLVGTAWNTPGRVACYDISDPAHPKPESGIEIAHGARIAVSGSRIAVLTTGARDSGLQLFDASRPDQLQLFGRLGLSSPVAMQLVGDTVYVVNAALRGRGANSLVVVDISVPGQPRPVREIAIPPTSDIAVQGRYAYLACSKGRNVVADEQTGLFVLDLVPGQEAGTGLMGAVNRLKSLIVPTQEVGAQHVARMPLGNVQNIAVQGPYAYVTVGRERYSDKRTGGLRIVDVSDPSNPQLKSVFPADEAGATAIAGTTLCVNVSAQWQHRFCMLDVSEPTRPLLIGAAPSRETLGYMKRRGRRLLHALALRDPETYVQTAAQMLLDAGQIRSELDPRTQWISMDLLYGGGTRYEQQAHGRGSYGTPRPGISIRSREERHPELWDRYPELAEQLYTTPKLPWQTWETACKILRNAHAPLPALSDRMLVGFLASASPLLRSIAGRQVAAMLLEGRNVAADIVADTYFGGTRRQRDIIARFLVRQEGNTRWTAAFAARLFQIVGAVVNDADLPRKASLSFALLISRFPALLPQDIAPRIAITLYNTRRPEFTDWALLVFRNLLPATLPKWLFALESLPEDVRETAVQAVVAGFATKAIPQTAFWDLFQSPIEWIRQMSWRILAHSLTPAEDIASLWSGLLNSDQPVPALLTAFASPDAIDLFLRCNFDSDQIALQLERFPFLIPLLPTAAWEKVVAVLPTTAVMRLVAGATEEQWPGLRAAILVGPLLPEHREAFWREAFRSIGATGDTILTHRLLADATLQGAFLQLADVSEFLRSANPVFGPLLGQWVGAHTDLLRRDSAELLQIATHPLPEIRSIGLERVRRDGMGLPFALRLLESEIPPSVALGKTFFERIDAEDIGRTEAITALCDSPKPSVRAFGRELLTGRPEMLAETDVLERLSENPDPETQAFVAGRLLKQPTPAETTGAFDRSVLRARDRGRRAKELVKARLDTQPTSDVALLLEMARSRTPRDADWALGQLAKLALEGVEIPGFTLDGVAGG